MKVQYLIKSDIGKFNNISMDLYIPIIKYIIYILLLT